MRFASSPLTENFPPSGCRRRVAALRRRPARLKPLDAEGGPWKSRCCVISRTPSTRFFRLIHILLTPLPTAFVFSSIRIYPSPASQRSQHRRTSFGKRLPSAVLTAALGVELLDCTGARRRRSPACPTIAGPACPKSVPRFLSETLSVVGDLLLIGKLRSVSRHINGGGV